MDPILVLEMLVKGLIIIIIVTYISLISFLLLVTKNYTSWSRSITNVNQAYAMVIRDECVALNCNSLGMNSIVTNIDPMVMYHQFFRMAIPISKRWCVNSISAKVIVKINVTN